MSNKIIFDNGNNFIVTNSEFKYRKVWITLNLMTVVLFMWFSLTWSLQLGEVLAELTINAELTILASTQKENHFCFSPSYIQILKGHILPPLEGNDKGREMTTPEYTLKHKYTIISKI